MKVIAVVNQKGGVAKSTTAYALGAYLTRSGKRIIYIDLDAQGNLTYTLRAEAGAASAFEVLTRKAEPKAALIPLFEGKGGAALLASTPELATADMTLSEIGKEYRLKEALAQLDGDYDYAIVDTPPSLGVLTINALTAASGAIIPAQADIYSIQGTSQLFATLSMIRSYTNRELKVMGVLLTRFQPRSIISRDTAKELEGMAASASTRLFSARVRECTAIKEAQARRESIFDYAPGSNAAADYAAFCEEAIKEI